MKEDGHIIIGVDLDTKQLERKIRESENKLKKHDVEAKKLTERKEKIEFDNSQLEETIKRYDELVGKAEKYRAIMKKTDTLANPNVSQEQQIADSIAYQRAQDELTKINAEILKMEGNFNKSSDKLENNNYELENIKKKLKENRQEHEKTTGEIEKQKEQLAEANAELQRTKGMNAIKDSINSASNSLTGLVKKVAHWGLALIGVRTLYSGIRQAVSMVSAKNEEVAAHLDQMRSVIASALLPLVQSVVRFLAKVMIYINYIFKVLTGRNLFNFADATKKGSDNLSKGAKGAGGIADNLKEARKQLAGFDEMNVLSDNVSGSGGGGGAGGIDADEFGNIFDSLKNVKIPKWLQKLGEILKNLKKYWKELILVVAAFGAALLAVKIGSFIAGLLGIEALSAGVIASIALIAAGVVLLAGSIVNLILNWDEMSAKEKVISGALAAVGAAFIALGVSIALGISAATLGIGLLVAAVVALVAVIGGLIAKHEIERASIHDVKKAQEELTEAKNRAKEAENNLMDAVDRQTEAQKRLKEVQDETKISGEELAKQVEDGKLTYQTMTEEQKKVYRAYRDLEQANKDVKTAEKDKEKADKDQVVAELNKQLATAKSKDDYKKLKEQVTETWKQGKIDTKDAQKIIEKSMAGMSDKSKQTFTKDLPANLKNGLDPNKYESTWTKFKNKWNSFWNGLKTNLSMNINANYSGSSGGGRGFAKGGMVYHALPKLAPGGIVNQPGRGVPIGRAIAGERGAEGVIPLTDSQQMALLGEAIGRYITVNASIINTMNGRVISRELQKINNEDDFAFNR